MIYFTTGGGGGAVIILEPTEVGKLVKGIPVETPDKNIMLCYTPDMEWFEKEFKAMLALHGGSVEAVSFDNIMRLSQYREKVFREDKPDIVIPGKAGKR